MSKLLLAGGAATLAASTTAFGAGIERNAPSTRILFEEGRYLEFSSSYVSPELEGRGGSLDPTSGGTGDLLESYASFGAGYKADLNDRLSYALILSNSVGVDTLYPTVATSGYSGTSADLDGLEVSAILAYDISDRVKVYAGVRAQSIEAEAFFPFFGALTVAGGAPVGAFGTYDVQADKDWSAGYMVGAAYQIPDIALRVALTYYSEIEHELDTVETIAGPAGGVTRDAVDIATPESVNLEFQTGIAADTLLFGSVRWVNWSEFRIAPTAFTGTLGVPLVQYEEDWTTYTLGVGRRFNENWSGAVQISHEPSADFTLTTLGPVDGRTSYGVGLTYTVDNVRITGGLSYVRLGDAENFAATQFEDGDAIGFGLRVGYTF